MGMATARLSAVSEGAPPGKCSSPGARELWEPVSRVPMSQAAVGVFPRRVLLSTGLGFRMWSLWH